MLNTWLSVVMLSFEASTVVGLRMLKMSGGGTEAYDEAQLMVVEKIRASIESVVALMGGSTPHSVIERYRDHVAVRWRLRTSLRGRGVFSGRVCRWV
jgi:hypothetical protein